jgi:hypothetical protein
MPKLFWDFYGPAAEQTAQHFAKHLTEFLCRNGHAAASTGLASAGAGHQAVWCSAEADAAAGIARALRARRIEPDGAAQ